MGFATPGTLNDPSTPFYLGEPGAPAGTSESGGQTRAIPTTITLDGYTFPVEMLEWRSGPMDTFRDGVVADGQASDALFNARGAWARYAYSWHHGAGQTLSDLDPDADSFRFEDSYGVTWHDPYELTLLRATTKNHTSANSNLVMCRSADYVFCGDGADLYRTTDLVTWTAMTAPGGTIQALSSDGTDLYVATSTKLVKYVGTNTASTAFAAPVAGNCTNVAFMSGRLVVGIDEVLSEVAAGGGLTTIKDHFQTAFRWTTLFNIGSRMYIGGFAGSRSELYTVTTDSAGALVQSQEAAPLPVGELLRGGVSFAGSAALCTSKGIRMAEVSGDGTLTYGPLITDVGDVRCAVGDGRFLFAGWSTMPDAEGSGVARLTLDVEVAPLQPAYSQDVYETALQATVMGVARLNDRTAFSVAGSGIWVESSTTFVGQGQVDSGRVAFGTVEPKALLSISLTFAPLLAGEAIEVYVYDENGVLVGAGSQSELSARTLEVDLEGEQVPFVWIRVILLGPGTSTPLLYQWRIRSYPIAPPMLQWVLPLICHETVTINGGKGQQQSMNLDAINTWIEDLWGRKQFTMLRIGTRQYKVRVETFEWRPKKWTGDGALPQGLLVVQCVNAA